MDYRLLSKNGESIFYDQIFEMMRESDKDFIPPLSARNSTTQSDLSSQSGTSDGLKTYFEEMKKQRFMVCTDGDILVAFVSFKEDFINDIISSEDLPNIYLSTLIMRPEYRGNGVTQKLYTRLFEIYEDANIFTRTWSTNGAHIKILSKFRFETLATIKDDRGIGIDTVYFVKRRA